MYRSFLLASALATALAANAQTTVHQVVVLNEGHYDFGSGLQDVPVTLGSYDPASGTYQTVATIDNARFGNHVKVDNGVIYVAADSFLLKYDADSYALLGSTVLTGVRRFAIWNDQLIVTRGELGGLDHYVDVLDKHTLQPIYHVSTTDLPYSCEGIQVVGDKAYFAVNNGFAWGNTVGKVGVLDLATQTYLTSIDLGPDGLNPENLMVDGNALYTFNNKDFTGSSVSRIALDADVLDHTDNVALNSSCAASEYTLAHDVYYLEYAVGHIARFDVETREVADTLMASPNAYGLIDDPIDHVMYATTTDYVTTGELHVMDYEGHVLNTVAVGVAPGRLALDVRTSTGIAEAKADAITLYPNPADGEVFLRAPGSTATRVTICDATGRVVLDAQRTLAADARFDVSGFAPGVYTVRVGAGQVMRFAKR